MEVQLVAGQTQALTATAHYSDDSSEDHTAEAVWSTTNPAVAAFRGNELIALGEGETVALARSGNVVSEPVPVTVAAVRAVEIVLDPQELDIAAGGTSNITATARFNDGNNADVTQLAMWRSSNEVVAAVSNVAGAKGAVSGFVAGQTLVTAVFQDVVSGPATVRVTDAELERIEVTPQDPVRPLGLPVQFMATGHYSDGAQIDLTPVVMWASSNADVAAFNGDPGVATTLQAGQTDVTATLGDVVSAAQTLSVAGARVLSVAVTLEANDIPAGTVTQATATAQLSDGSEADYTNQVEWRSGTPATAVVGPNGRVTALAAGQTDIRAIAGEVESEPVRLRVVAVELVELVVDPADADVAVGSTLRLTATGRFNDGSEANVTGQAVWRSANDFIATVGDAGGDKGAVRGVAPGETQITATLNGVAAVAQISVSAAALERVEVTPAEFELPLGLTEPFTATAYFADGSDRDVTGEATWRSDAEAIATVGNEGAERGRVTGVGAGEANIYAALGETESPPAVVTVVAAELVGVRIDPLTADVVLDETFQFRAHAEFSDGSEQDVTEEAQWSLVGDMNVATISNAPGAAAW